MASDILPPDQRHEAFAKLMAAYSRLDEAEKLLLEALDLGDWGHVPREINHHTSYFLTRARREAETLLERAGKTAKQTQLR